MTIKILNRKEYQAALKSDSIVSELELELATHQLVAVKLSENSYKILKYPRLLSMIDEFDLEKLNTVVTKEELQKFIFLFQI